jgi:NADH:ubiquinone oxidoreductase subunit
MGMFANLFTWWNGASLGTTIVSRRNGEEVGRDEAGNIYFRHR